MLFNGKQKKNKTEAKNALTWQQMVMALANTILCEQHYRNIPPKALSEQSTLGTGFFCPLRSNFSSLKRPPNINRIRYAILQTQLPPDCLKR